MPLGGKIARFALAAVALGFLFSCAKPDTLVLKDFTLIDGAGDQAAPGSSMIIEDGKIKWVGPTADLKAPLGAQTRDLAGKYVMPGIIDLHVHLSIVRDMKQDIANYTLENVQEDLKGYAKFGVTAVQVLGTDKDLIFPLRAAQRAGRPTMARVFTAGQGIVFKGGYGGVVGLNNPVSTVEEAVKAVDEQADKGVDLIKLWVDDELGTMLKMPPEISKAVIDEAHKRGLRAVAHIFYLEDAKRLVDQGIDGLAHNVRDRPVDQALIDAMKQKGVWQMADTLTREQAMFLFGTPSETLSDPLFKQAVSEKTLALLSSGERQKTIVANPHYEDYPKFLAQAEANTKALMDAGVNMGFGTDCGPPGRFPGYAEHRELELLVAAGMTPLQAINLATGKAAQFLRATDIGTLAAGKWADLIVLDADPLADIRNVHKINAVFIAGQSVPTVTQ
jgi:imidazolonepropionase-like amidohydrolase